MLIFMQLTDFHRVVAMNTLSGVGVGLVGIFIPIYLLELGFSLHTVIAWLLVHHLSLLAGAFLVVFVSNHIGLVRCWYIRIGLVALVFSGLLLLSTQPGLLFAVAFMSGLEAAFFWIPYNIFTVRKTSESTTGSSLAFMSNVGSAVGIFVPGAAAFLIVLFGYPTLFSVAFLCIVLSIVPVLALRKEKTEFRFNWSAIKDIVRSNKRFIIPEIFDNLGQDAGVIWSLFIFLTALTILDIGALGVITGIIGMIVTYCVGLHIDTGNKKTIMRVGAIATTLMWVVSYGVAVFAPTPILLYAVTALRGVALGIFVSAYSAIMFNRARSSDAQFLVLREIPTILGRVVVFVLAIFFASIGQFELTFLVVAVLSLYFWLNDIDSLLNLRSH